LRDFTGRRGSVGYFAEIGSFVQTAFTCRRVGNALTSCRLLTSRGLLLPSRQDSLGSGIVTGSIGSSTVSGAISGSVCLRLVILLVLLLLLDLILVVARD